MSIRDCFSAKAISLSFSAESPARVRRNRVGMALVPIWRSASSASGSRCPPATFVGIKVKRSSQ